MSIPTFTPLAVWLIDPAGNVAVSCPGLRLLARIGALNIPAFASTEHAMEWGASLSPEQHDTLLEVQRNSSNAAGSAASMQGMVDMATRSQLLREAAEAFVPGVDWKAFPRLTNAPPLGALNGAN